MDLNVDNIGYDTDYKIKFNNIKFMNIDDIKENDLERAVLPKDYFDNDSL